MKVDSTSSPGWWARKRKARGRRALERQLEYQEEKSRGHIEGDDNFVKSMYLRSRIIRHKLERVRPICDDDKVLEVGSGAHGLVFGFTSGFSVGIDPLAVNYKRLFPKWQPRAITLAAIGEELPFEDASFDVVLSDNVVDHAEDPVKIINALVRVLKPGGILYFTVNIHHPFYDLVSRAHGLWNGIGLKLEISPFADHTVHFSERQIRNVFSHLAVNTVSQISTIAETKAANRAIRNPTPDNFLKRVFFKNALFEIVAVRD
ncbi:MAG: methyltransferase domain-containing protein [Pyrinomonadaceae bacterium]